MSTLTPTTRTTDVVERKPCRAFQETVQVLGVLSACVRHVCSSAEAPALNTVRSLPFCILKVLRDTFQHCKVNNLLM